MESVPAKVTVSRRVILSGMLALAIGCVGTPKTGAPAKKVDVDPNAPAQVAVTWNPKVCYAADPFRGGTIMPVISGRMYVFASSPGAPLVCDGKLVVDLWDHTPREGRTEPKMLEQWNLEAETLGKLEKEDIVGHGYTLMLPWGTYQEDITNVHLIIRFEPTGGKKSMMHQGSFTVDHQATKEIKSGPFTNVPGN